MKDNSTFSYELLVIDQTGKSEITTTKSMVLALSYSEKLWKNVVINEYSHQESIEDTSLGINLTVQKIPVSETSIKSAFVINISGNDLEKADYFRLSLFAHIKNNLRFSAIVILNDEISGKISRDIFSLLNGVEDALRTSLVHSYIQGKNFTNIIKNLPADQEIFGVQLLPAGSTEFGNFAKQVFPGNDFASNWEKITTLRRKVMQNETCVYSDYIEALEVSRDITSLVAKSQGIEIDINIPVNEKRSNSAINNYPEITEKVVQKEYIPVREVTYKEEPYQTPVMPTPVMEPVRNNVSTYQPVTFKEESTPVIATPVVTEPEVKKEIPAERVVKSFEMITEKELLSELKQIESSSRGIVELKAFATEILGPKGFAPGSVYSLTRSMSEKGMVRIYDAKDAQGYTVKAIKTL